MIRWDDEDEPIRLTFGKAAVFFAGLALYAYGMIWLAVQIGERL